MNVAPVTLALARSVVGAALRGRPGPHGGSRGGHGWRCGRMGLAGPALWYNYCERSGMSGEGRGRLRVDQVSFRAMDHLGRGRQ